MDLFKIIAALGTLITLAGLAVLLGRILQKLDDLGEKVATTLDPEKGVIKDLRDAKHAAKSVDQDLINRLELVKIEFASYKRETAAEFVTIRREIHVDEQLSQIKAMLRDQRRPPQLPPGHGHDGDGG